MIVIITRWWCIELLATAVILFVGHLGNICGEAGVTALTEAFFAARAWWYKQHGQFCLHKMMNTLSWMPLQPISFCAYENPVSNCLCQQHWVLNLSLQQLPLLYSWSGADACVSFASATRKSSGKQGGRQNIDFCLKQVDVKYVTWATFLKKSGFSCQKSYCLVHQKLCCLLGRSFSIKMNYK